MNISQEAIDRRNNSLKKARSQTVERLKELWDSSEDGIDTDDPDIWIEHVQRALIEKGEFFYCA